jgi:hypothetical protein
MVEKLAEAEVWLAEMAGIDFRESPIPEADPSSDLKGAMDLLSFSSLRLLAVPTNGKSSASSSESGSGGGGGDATSLIVLGRSSNERPEYRLGTPTVEAGEGGRESTISSILSCSCSGS